MTMYTWPVNRHTFSTANATPVETTIAELGAGGDLIALPLIYVVARTDDAAAGNILNGSYTFVDIEDTPTLITETEKLSLWGGGGLGIALEIQTRELVVVATGIAGDVEWGLFWRRVGFPPP